MRRRLVDAVLAAGSSQLFWYASLPLITRLYSKESIGLFGQFVTYTGIIALVIGARADLAVLTAKQSLVRITRLAFFKLSIYILIAILVMAITALFLFDIDSFFASIDGVLLLLAGALFACHFMIDGAVLVKKNSYKALRETAFLRSLIQSSLQIFLSGLGVLGLFLGKIIGDIVGSRLRSRASKMNASLFRGRENKVIRITRREAVALRSNARAYKYSFPQTLVNSFSQGLPFIVLPLHAPPDWMGQYALAFMIVVAPIGLIAAPIRQMLLAVIADNRHAGADASSYVRGRLKNITLLLASLSLAAFLLIEYLAKPLVRLAFGDGWDQAAVLMSYLWIWAGTGLASTPIQAYLIAYDGNKSHLIFELVQMVGRIAMIIIGVSFFSGDRLILPFVIWSGLANSLFALWVWRGVR